MAADMSWAQDVADWSIDFDSQDEFADSLDDLEGDSFLWPWECGLGCTQVRDPVTNILRCEKFPGSRCTGRCVSHWLTGACCCDS